MAFSSRSTGLFGERISLPLALYNSWDWQRRGIVFLEVTRASKHHWLLTMDARREFFLPQFPLPEGLRLDAVTARSADEFHYCHNLVEATAAGLLQGYRDVSADLLFMPKPRLRVDSDGCSLPFGPNLSGYEPPLSLLQFERQHRHNLSVFVSYHMREAATLKGVAIAERYVPLPPWWHNWEVSYVTSAKSPEFFTYSSSWMLDAATPDTDRTTLWALIKSEHALNCLKALYLHAVETRRVLWFPDEIRRSGRVMGIDNMLAGCSASVVSDVMRLVQQGECFRWSLCPLINTQLPGYTGPHTPVFETTGE